MNLLRVVSGPNPLGRPGASMRRPRTASPPSAEGGVRGGVRLDLWVFVILETEDWALAERVMHLGRERSGFSQAASRLHQRKTWGPGIEERLDSIGRNLYQMPISQA